MLLNKFCLRTLNNSLNHIYEQAPRLEHDNYNVFFYDILEMSNEKLYTNKILTCHQRNV